MLAICKVRACEGYVNAIGGRKLYHEEEFLKEKIELRFIQSTCREYRQFHHSFVPSLSIVDVLMFNAKEQVSEMLKEYQLIRGE